MLKKLSKPNENLSQCALLIIQGAKKRRNLAHCAVNASNGKYGISPNIVVVK